MQIETFRSAYKHHPNLNNDIIASMNPVGDGVCHSHQHNSRHDKAHLIVRTSVLGRQRLGSVHGSMGRSLCFPSPLLLLIGKEEWTSLTMISKRLVAKLLR